jgi:hypothetical protein
MTTSSQPLSRLWRALLLPPWRTFAGSVAFLVLAGLVYIGWTPGTKLSDGRHDLRTNGIWLQHGWLGDDSWFERNARDMSGFRDSRRIRELAHLLASHGVRYVFPHLCPCDQRGTIAPVDDEQTERFLDQFSGFDVIPWVGGVLGQQCFPESEAWRREFVRSSVDLLQRHPRLAGIQVNIEPLPDGNQSFLLLLDELQAALPEGKILSVVAYPPPTRWQPYVEIHWGEEYVGEVARRVDLFVPMMYDTSIRLPKLYQNVMAGWTSQILRWTGSTEVLLGVPAYEDADTGYHHPGAENLRDALRGIHAGLAQLPSLPDHYAGVAIYCEWEMNDAKWETLRREFGRSP